MTKIGMAIDPSGLRRVERRRGRLRTGAQVVLGVVAVAQLGTAGWIVNQRSVSTAVVVDDVLADFRARDASSDDEAATPPSASTPTPSVDTSTVGPSEELASGEPVSDVASTPDAGSSAAPPASSSTRPAGDSGEPIAAPANASLGLPQEGVYTYAASGYESISLGGARHDYPERTHAIVEHGSGCEWSLDHRVVEEKRTRATYCNEGPVQQALRYRQWLTFYGSTVESDYRCDRGTRTDLRDVAGDMHQGSCTDGEGTSTDTVTFLGREELTIGGEVVETLHYRVDTVLTGNVEGSALQHVWALPESALPVRIIRETRSRAHEFGAEVNYVEEAEFTLTSLVPQR